MQIKKYMTLKSDLVFAKTRLLVSNTGQKMCMKSPNVGNNYFGAIYAIKLYDVTILNMVPNIILSCFL